MVSSASGVASVRQLSNVRYQADSNRCRRFCRPQPSLSAMVPCYFLKSLSALEAAKIGRNLCLSAISGLFFTYFF